MYIGEYEVAYESYPFSNYLFTCYWAEDSYYDIVVYCKNVGIDVITIPEWSTTYSLISYSINCNFTVYTHTVNTVEEMEYWYNLGVDGIYSDYLF